DYKVTGVQTCALPIFVHRIDRSVHVVGAGQPIGNGKDQLNWRASWGVASPRHVRGYGGFGRDLLYINQPGAPSGWVVWDGRAYEIGRASCRERVESGE